MTSYTYCCPKSVKACAFRFTRHVPGTGMPQNPLFFPRTVQGSAFVEVTVTPDYQAGSEKVVSHPGSTLPAVIERDFDVLKGLDISMKLCGQTTALVVLPGANGLGVTVDEVANRVDVAGLMLGDMSTSCAPSSWTLELWSKNAGDPCYDETYDDKAWVHWVLPMTSHWTLKGNLTFANDALEMELAGYARQNEWWYPSYPGPEFNSYVGGVVETMVPSGAPPCVLPAVIPAPDEFTLADVAAVRAGGPMGFKCVSSLPSPLDDCGFVPSDPCDEQQTVFADGPWTPGSQLGAPYTSIDMPFVYVDVGG